MAGVGDRPKGLGSLEIGGQEELRKGGRWKAASLEVVGGGEMSMPEWARKAL